MQPFITKLNRKLNFQLQKIDLEETDIIKKAQKSIICLKSALNELKTFNLNYAFKNEDEEFIFSKRSNWE